MGQWPISAIERTLLSEENAKRALADSERAERTVQDTQNSEIEVLTKTFSLLWSLALSKKHIDAKQWTDRVRRRYQSMAKSSEFGLLVRPKDPDIWFQHAVATLCVKHWNIIAVTRYDGWDKESREDVASRTYLIVPNGCYKSVCVLLHLH